MAKRTSRHERLGTYASKAGGRTVELYRPRVVPLGIVTAQHKVSAHDRLDSIAQRYYSDPLQYWRIADANPSDTPEDLLEAGRQLDVPDVD